jgi:hypothetical protein
MSGNPGWFPLIARSLSDGAPSTLARLKALGG